MDFMPFLQSKIDDQKPSLFELISEAQLSSLIPPSLRYLLTVATHRHPRYLLRILNSFDEIYAVLMIIIEHHYIKTYGGGFTENFYGLKREKVPAVGEIRRATIAAPSHVSEALALTSADIWKNIAVMVGVPYLKRKIDESYEINTPRSLLGASYTQMPVNPTFKQRLVYYYRWFLRNVYPSINAAYYFSILAFNLSYLYGNSKYHSPFLWLIRTRIRRLAETENQTTSVSRDSQKTSDSESMGSWVLGSLRTLLPTSIFLLNFLEWWYASDFSRQLSKKASEFIDLPPPVNAEPSKLPKSCEEPNSEPNSAVPEEKSDSEIHITNNTPIASVTLLPIYTVSPLQNPAACPICQREIITAAACQTGFVYCYTCIHRWIEGNHDKQIEFMKGKQGKWDSGKGRCAVSGRKLLGGTEGLRRLIL